MRARVPLSKAVNLTMNYKIIMRVLVDEMKKHSYRIQSIQNLSVDEIKRMKLAENLLTTLKEDEIPKFSHHTRRPLLSKRTG